MKRVWRKIYRASVKQICTAGGSMLRMDDSEHYLEFSIVYPGSTWSRKLLILEV
jgi:hypothetical protein